jgi:hypothetical protein
VYVERTMMGPADAPLAARRVALMSELLPHLPPGSTLAAVGSQVDRLSFDDVFDFGLRSIIHGIEAERARPARKPAARRRS